jgi:hypothetical protein
MAGHWDNQDTATVPFQRVGGTNHLRQSRYDGFQSGTTDTYIQRRRENTSGWVEHSLFHCMDEIRGDLVPRGLEDANSRLHAVVPTESQLAAGNGCKGVPG